MVCVSLCMYEYVCKSWKKLEQGELSGIYGLVKIKNRPKLAPRLPYRLYPRSPLFCFSCLFSFSIFSFPSFHSLFCRLFVPRVTMPCTSSRATLVHKGKLLLISLHDRVLYIGAVACVERKTALSLQQVKVSSYIMLQRSFKHVFHYYPLLLHFIKMIFRVVNFK